MIRFGRTPSVNFCDKHITVVLFATVHCRGVEKVRKKVEKDPVTGKKKCLRYFNNIFVWMVSFEGLRDCNATLKRKVVLVRAMKTCKGSRHTAVLTDWTWRYFAIGMSELYDRASEADWEVANPLNWLRIACPTIIMRCESDSAFFPAEIRKFQNVQLLMTTFHIKGNHTIIVT